MANSVRALIADIGATHSRIAMVYDNDLNHYHNVEVFLSGQFDAPDEIIRAYCVQQSIELPSLILLAIAAPVELNDIQFVNNHWAFQLSDVKSRLLPANVHFFNDVEMLGYALPHLPDSSLMKIGKGECSEYAPKLAVSLGSGIGTTLVIHHHDWLAIPSEGGHSSMMIEDEFTNDFWQYLRGLDQSHEIIVEDFIAGKKGIPQLISYMSDQIDDNKKTATPVSLVERLITKKDTFAVQLFDRYCAMIGGVVRNYTLITGAKSVYLAGGIIPRFLEFFAQSEFRASFEASTSVGQILEKIPTYVVTDPYPALTGLTRKVAYMEDTKE